MAKKKNTTQNDIVSLYMDYVLTHNQRPKTVYAFAKENKFEEQKFYEFFTSFDVLEQSIFQIFFDNTLELLNKSEDYQNFEAKDKLLSFYYTFFEMLSANRSYVVYAAGEKQSIVTFNKITGKLKSSFNKYIKHLNIDTLDLKQDKLEKLKNKGISESFWFQMVLIFNFWMKDTSSSFEKTDLFIEKSVRASFDLLDTTPLNSLIDFGKFLFKEKMHMK
ncbi:MAG: TetR/AcrR family transcriptional regulator [Winogradskyella sp.]|uniref:TetR family transcriptional regulator C-terminal domain-containing protein n=1 Tax=Winogradskyella sp. TaxID=1883156 RepID=UPI0025F348E6|nr:TetR family transcriptional regulator C-terminal domain-containing protein [Winogradskyella sp.]NRB61188.1 TetR/AcrR family transcriptional regulator [Winogradskyella sp.]